MTQSFSVDSNNDIFIGREGSLSISRGIDAVLFACAHAAKTVQGEMVYAVDEGIPYFDVAWNGAPRLAQFEAFLRRALLAVADVIDVAELETEAVGNTLQYRAVITTIYGAGRLNG